jgi:hypothetical protein
MEIEIILLIIIGILTFWAYGGYLEQKKHFRKDREFKC